MKKGNTELLFPSIPKPQRDSIFPYWVFANLRRQELAAGKAYYRKANPYIVIQYYKSFRVVDRIKGAALALQKRQFIKKPKNPI